MSERLSGVKNEQEKTKERFHVDPAEYPILRQQYELDAHWGDNTQHTWNIDKTLGTFVADTANLIAEIDGTSTEYESNAELAKPDHVIYLDKSARPVSWLVNVFWDKFSENERPAHSYLNIDRQPWFRASGVQVDANGYVTAPDGSQHRASSHDFNINNVPEDTFARIRGLYLDGGIESENPEEIMNTPSKLDGKNILIVDEVRRSGATLEIAQELIKRAFPEAASVRGAYFWESGTKNSPDGEESQMLSVPVWYDSSTQDGRGAGDVDKTHYDRRHEEFQTPRTRAQKYGAMVLSVIHDLGKERGGLSRELMREVKQMRQDFDDGKILMRYPRKMNDEKIEEYIESVGLRLAPVSDKSPDTYVNALKEIDARKA